MERWTLRFNNKQDIYLVSPIGIHKLPPIFPRKDSVFSECLYKCEFDPDQYRRRKQQFKKEKAQLEADFRIEAAKKRRARYREDLENAKNSILKRLWVQYKHLHRKERHEQKYGHEGKQGEADSNRIEMDWLISTIVALLLY